MILAGLLAALVVASCGATEGGSDEEVPFVVASQGGSAGPEERGRSDVEVEEDGEFGGYFYPKPSKPFYLPPFKALGAEGATQLAEEEGAEVDRPQRSPQRWRPQNQRPPPFIPGFIPPSPIRPLPAQWTGPVPGSGIRPLPGSGIRPLPAAWNGRAVGY